MTLALPGVYISIWIERRSDVSLAWQTTYVCTSATYCSAG